MDDMEAWLQFLLRVALKLYRWSLVRPEPAVRTEMSSSLVTVQTTWNSTGQSLHRLVCPGKTQPPDHAGLLEWLQKVTYCSFCEQAPKGMHISNPCSYLKYWPGDNTLRMKNCLAGLCTKNPGVALQPGYPKGLVKESLCSKEPDGGGKENQPNTHIWGSIKLMALPGDFSCPQQQMRFC